MKHIFIVLLLTISLGASNSIQAQGAQQEREYTRQRDAANIRAANAASIKQNEANSRPFESKWGSATGVFDKQSYGTSATKSAEQIAADQKWLETKRKWDREEMEERAERARLNEEQANRDAWRKGKSAAYRKEFDRAGFLPASIEMQEFMHTRFASVDNNQPERARLFGLFALQMQTAKSSFEKAKASAPAGELLSYISEYTPAWETSLADLQYLSGKHPAAQQDIDELALTAIAYYYGVEISPQLGRSHSAPMYDEENNLKIATRFADICARNPTLVAAKYAAVGRSGEGPMYDPFSYALLKFRSAARQYDKPANPDPQRYEAVLHAALYTPHPPEKFLYEMQRINVLASEKFWMRYKEEDWKQIFRLHGNKSIVLLERLWSDNSQSFDYETHHFSQMSAIHGKKKKDRYFYSHFATPLEAWGMLTAVKAGVAIGDPDALNTYAIITARGLSDRSEKDFSGMLKQAANQGSLWAQLNLLVACGWDADGYGPEDHPAAVANFKQWLSKASTKELIALVKHMKSIKEPNTFTPYVKAFFNEELVNLVYKTESWKAE